MLTTSLATGKSAPAIRIESLGKWFGIFQVLKDINLTIDNAERIVLCGPSGSGKSTLIRCINALETHQVSTRCAEKWIWSSSISTCFRT